MSKSCIYVANTATQNVAIGGTINLGTVLRRCGCNCASNGGSVTISGTGFYDVTANIVVAPDAAGSVSVSLYKDGSPVTGANAIASAAADDVITLPINAIVREVCCCDSTSQLTLVLSGTASEVSNVTITVTKL